MYGNVKWGQLHWNKGTYILYIHIGVRCFFFFFFFNCNDYHTVDGFIYMHTISTCEAIFLVLRYGMSMVTGTIIPMYHTAMWCIPSTDKGVGRPWRALANIGTSLLALYFPAPASLTAGDIMDLTLYSMHALDVTEKAINCPFYVCLPMRMDRLAAGLPGARYSKPRRVLVQYRVSSSFWARTIPYTGLKARKHVNVM